MLLKDFKLVKSLDELLSLGYEPDDFTRAAFERGATIALIIGEDGSALVAVQEPAQAQEAQNA